MGCFDCFGTKAKPKNRSQKSNIASRETEPSSPSVVELISERKRFDSSPYKNSEKSNTHSQANHIHPHKLQFSEKVRESNHVITGKDEEGHKTINQYVQIQQLGSGSYSKVFLYRNMETNRHFAVKVCNKSHLKKVFVTAGENALMDVYREIFVLKMVNHPNIIQLEEVIDDPECDKLYIVLEYVEGGDMFEGSRPHLGITEQSAKKYFKDLVSAIMYLHDHNIIHGDIKPDNILVDGDGNLKLTDFGSSRHFDDGNDLIRRSPGTPLYTAPECCHGSPYSGKMADVWALGCTLFVFVTGKYPFHAKSIASTYEKIVNDDIHIPDRLSPNLQDLLNRLLEKDPNKRIKLIEAYNHPWIIQHPKRE